MARQDIVLLILCREILYQDIVAHRHYVESIHCGMSHRDIVTCHIERHCGVSRHHGATLWTLCQVETSWHIIDIVAHRDIVARPHIETL